MVNPIINQRLNEQNKNQIKIKEWIENCKSIISFSAPPLSLHNQDELLLSYLAGIWLLEFLNNNLRIKSSIEVFNKLKALTTKFPQSSPLWVFLNSIFKFLNEETILDSLLCIKIPELQESLIDDTLGTLLQKLLGFEERKRLAANYTTMNSAKVLMKVLDTNTYSSIVDPFCGSGRLISVYLESLNNKNQFPSIRIHDLMPSAVLIAYCRLVLILSQYKQDLSLLHATIGDAFETFLKESSRKAKKYDLVLMNPPFTRTHRIGKKQRNNLSKIEQKYTKYLSGQIGLHIYAIFLADLFLNENGLLGAILPASTILSQYSRGIHEFFLSNYQLKTIASSEDEKAHSEDSNLREIILIAKKRSDIQIEGIQFLRLASQSKSNGQILPSGLISKERLAKEWNWTIFLKDPELLKIRNILLQSGWIKSGNNLDLDIVRGVEMYGPDFFFVPNCKWKIISENKNKFILKSVGSTIKIPKKFLIRSLRKPGKYNQFITPEVSDYALNIPNSDRSHETWMRGYLNVSEQYASPAKRRFGNDWIHHIHNQVERKKPMGNLFFIDKFGITSTGVMAHFFDSKLTCSKNFYVLRNYSPLQAKLEAAWLNSTLFIILFLLSRREIGGSYGRLQIIDYKREPLFLDFSNYDSVIKDQIIRQFDLIRRLKLPPISEQLQFPQRRNLDRVIIQGLQLPKITEEYLQVSIYPLLERIFINLKRRDKG